MELTWDEMDRLLLEVVMRVPIWKSEVPHTLASRTLRFKLEQERDEKGKQEISLTPFD